MEHQFHKPILDKISPVLENFSTMKERTVVSEENVEGWTCLNNPGNEWDHFCVRCPPKTRIVETVEQYIEWADITDEGAPDSWYSTDEIRGAVEKMRGPYSDEERYIRAIYSAYQEDANQYSQDKRNIDEDVVYKLAMIERCKYYHKILRLKYFRKCFAFIRGPFGAGKSYTARHIAGPKDCIILGTRQLVAEYFFAFLRLYEYKIEEIPVRENWDFEDQQSYETLMKWVRAFHVRNNSKKGYTKPHGPIMPYICTYEIFLTTSIGFNTLFYDEGPLFQFSDIMMGWLHNTRVNRFMSPIIIMGDQGQVNKPNFISKTKLLTVTDFIRYMDNTFFLNQIWRCTADVIAVMIKHFGYPETLRTVRKDRLTSYETFDGTTTADMVINNLNSKKQVSLDYWKKDNILKRRWKPGCAPYGTRQPFPISDHEAQGKEKSVVLYDMNRRSLNPESQGHIVVGLTRHTDRCLLTLPTINKLPSPFVPKVDLAQYTTDFVPYDFTGFLQPLFELLFNRYQVPELLNQNFVPTTVNELREILGLSFSGQSDNICAVKGHAIQPVKGTDLWKCQRCEYEGPESDFREEEEEFMEHDILGNLQIESTVDEDSSWVEETPEILTEMDYKPRPFLLTKHFISKKMFDMMHQKHDTINKRVYEQPSVLNHKFYNHCVAPESFDDTRIPDPTMKESHECTEYCHYKKIVVSGSHCFYVVFNEPVCNDLIHYKMFPNEILQKYPCPSNRSIVCQHLQALTSSYSFEALHVGCFLWEKVKPYSKGGYLRNVITDEETFKDWVQGQQGYAELNVFELPKSQKDAFHHWKNTINQIAPIVKEIMLKAAAGDFFTWIEQYRPKRICIGCKELKDRCKCQAIRRELLDSKVRYSECGKLCTGPYHSCKSEKCVKKHQKIGNLDKKKQRRAREQKRQQEREKKEQEHACIFCCDKNNIDYHDCPIKIRNPDNVKRNDIPVITGNSTEKENCAHCERPLPCFQHCQKHGKITSDNGTCLKCAAEWHKPPAQCKVCDKFMSDKRTRQGKTVCNNCSNCSNCHKHTSDLSYDGFFTYCWSCLTNKENLQPVLNNKGKDRDTGEDFVFKNHPPDPPPDGIVNISEEIRKPTASVSTVGETSQAMSLVVHVSAEPQSAEYFGELYEKQGPCYREMCDEYEDGDVIALYLCSSIDLNHVEIHTHEDGSECLCKNDKGWQYLSGSQYFGTSLCTIRVNADGIPSDIEQVRERNGECFRGVLDTLLLLSLPFDTRVFYRPAMTVGSKAHVSFEYFSGSYPVEFIGVFETHREGGCDGLENDYMGVTLTTVFGLILVYCLWCCYNIYHRYSLIWVPHFFFNSERSIRENPDCFGYCHQMLSYFKQNVILNKPVITYNEYLEIYRQYSRKERKHLRVHYTKDRNFLHINEIELCDDRVNGTNLDDFHLFYSNNRHLLLGKPLWYIPQREHYNSETGEWSMVDRYKWWYTRDKFGNKEWDYVPDRKRKVDVTQRPEGFSRQHYERRALTFRWTGEEYKKEQMGPSDIEQMASKRQYYRRRNIIYEIHPVVVRNIRVIDGKIHEKLRKRKIMNELISIKTVAQFEIARNSSIADIELNPGPVHEISEPTCHFSPATLQKLSVLCIFHLCLTLLLPNKKGPRVLFYLFFALLMNNFWCENIEMMENFICRIFGLNCNWLIPQVYAHPTQDQKWVSPRCRTYLDCIVIAWRENWLVLSSSIAFTVLNVTVFLNEHYKLGLENFGQNISIEDLTSKNKIKTKFYNKMQEYLKRKELPDYLWVISIFQIFAIWISYKVSLGNSIYLVLGLVCYFIAWWVDEIGKWNIWSLSRYISKIPTAGIKVLTPGIYLPRTEYFISTQCVYMSTVNKMNGNRFNEFMSRCTQKTGVRIPLLTRRMYRTRLLKNIYLSTYWNDVNGPCMRSIIPLSRKLTLKEVVKPVWCYIHENEIENHITDYEIIGYHRQFPQAKIFKTVFHKLYSDPVLKTVYFGARWMGDFLKMAGEISEERFEKLSYHKVADNLWLNRSASDILADKAECQAVCYQAGKYYHNYVTYLRPENKAKFVCYAESYDFFNSVVNIEKENVEHYRSKFKDYKLKFKQSGVQLEIERSNHEKTKATLETKTKEMTAEKQKTKQEGDKNRKLIETEKALRKYLKDVYDDDYDIDHEEKSKSEDTTVKTKNVSLVLKNEDWHSYKFKSYKYTEVGRFFLDAKKTDVGKTVTPSFNGEPTASELAIMETFSTILNDTMLEIQMNQFPVAATNQKTPKLWIPSFMFKRYPRKFATTHLHLAFLYYASAYPHYRSAFEEMSVSNILISFDTQEYGGESGRQIRNVPVIYHLYELSSRYHRDKNECKKKMEHIDFVDSCPYRATLKLNDAVNGVSETEWNRQDLGIIQCPDCGIFDVVGESGPNDSNFNQCKNGHKISTGDHLYRADLIVIRKGNAWTSIRETITEKEWNLEGGKSHYVNDDKIYRWPKTSILKDQIHTESIHCRETNRSVHCHHSDTLATPYDHPIVDHNQSIHVRNDYVPLVLFTIHNGIKAKYLWDGFEYVGSPTVNEDPWINHTEQYLDRNKNTKLPKHPHAPHWHYFRLQWGKSYWDDSSLSEATIRFQDQTTLHQPQISENPVSFYYTNKEVLEIIDGAPDGIVKYLTTPELLRNECCEAGDHYYLKIGEIGNWFICYHKHRPAYSLIFKYHRVTQCDTLPFDTYVMRPSHNPDPDHISLYLTTYHDFDFWKLEANTFVKINDDYLMDSRDSYWHKHPYRPNTEWAHVPDSRYVFESTRVAPSEKFENSINLPLIKNTRLTRGSGFQYTPTRILQKLDHDHIHSIMDPTIAMAKNFDDYDNIISETELYSIQTAVEKYTENKELVYVTSCSPEDDWLPKTGYFIINTQGLADYTFAVEIDNKLIINWPVIKRNGWFLANIRVLIAIYSKCQSVIMNGRREEYKWAMLQRPTRFPTPFTWGTQESCSFCANCVIGPTDFTEKETQQYVYLMTKIGWWYGLDESFIAIKECTKFITYEVQSVRKTVCKVRFVSFGGQQTEVMVGELKDLYKKAREMMILSKEKYAPGIVGEYIHEGLYGPEDSSCTTTLLSAGEFDQNITYNHHKGYQTMLFSELEEDMKQKALNELGVQSYEQIKTEIINNFEYRNFITFYDEFKIGYNHCCLNQSGAFHRTIIVGEYKSYYVVCWYYKKYGFTSLSLISKNHQYYQSESIEFPVVVGMPHRLSWPDHFHAHCTPGQKNSALKDWGSYLLPENTRIICDARYINHIKHNVRHLHDYRRRALTSDILDSKEYTYVPKFTSVQSITEKELKYHEKTFEWPKEEIRFKRGTGTENHPPNIGIKYQRHLGPHALSIDNMSVVDRPASGLLFDLEEFINIIKDWTTDKKFVKITSGVQDLSQFEKWNYYINIRFHTCKKIRYRIMNNVLLIEIPVYLRPGWFLANIRCVAALVSKCQAATVNGRPEEIGYVIKSVDFPTPFTYRDWLTSSCGAMQWINPGDASDDVIEEFKTWCTYFGEMYGLDERIFERMHCYRAISTLDSTIERYGIDIAAKITLIDRDTEQIITTVTRANAETQRKFFSDFPQYKNREPQWQANWHPRGHRAWYYEQKAKSLERNLDDEYYIEGPKIETSIYQLWKRAPNNFKRLIAFFSLIIGTDATTRTETIAALKEPWFKLTEYFYSTCIDNSESMWPSPDFCVSHSYTILDSNYWEVIRNTLYVNLFGDRGLQISVLGCAETSLSMINRDLVNFSFRYLTWILEFMSFSFETVESLLLVARSHLANYLETTINISNDIPWKVAFNLFLTQHPTWAIFSSVWLFFCLNFVTYRRWKRISVFNFFSMHLITQYFIYYQTLTLDTMKDLMEMSKMNWIWLIWDLHVAIINPINWYLWFFKIITFPIKFLINFDYMILAKFIAFFLSSLTFIYLCYFILNTLIVLVEKYYFIFPDVLPSNPNGLLTISEHSHAKDFVRGQDLLIPVLGTHGDQIPVFYLARIAAFLGIRTHVWIIHTATWEELKRIRKGEMQVLLNGYIDLRLASWQGYKFTFGPHTQPIGPGASYQLAPSQKWIHPIRYTVRPHQTISSWVAEKMAMAFIPNFRIGCLSDCTLPRSADGRSLIKKHKNTGKYEACWVNGSAGEEVIPEEIRNNPDVHKISAPYDYSVFKDYKVVHMHGGAGTVQSAIACGATPKVWETTMDRDYRRLPTQKDFHQPSLLPFIGMLWVAGFTVKGIPSVITYFSVFKYYYDQKIIFLRQNLLILIRIYSLVTVLYKLHYFLICVFLSFPFLTIYGQTEEGMMLGRQIIGGLYNYPVVMCIDSWHTLLFVLLCVNNTLEKILFEINNWYKNRTSLIIRKVKNFPLPFGHMLLQDNVTGEQFEALHVTDDRGFLDAFGWVYHPFKDSDHREIIIPMPFSPALLREMIKNYKKNPYTAVHNCQSYVIKEVFHFGFFSTCALLLIFIGSLTILVPGEIATRICTHFDIKIFGVDLRHHFDPLAFAGDPGPSDVPLPPQDEDEEFELKYEGDEETNPDLYREIKEQERALLDTMKDEVDKEPEEKNQIIDIESEKEKLKNAGVPEHAIPQTIASLYKAQDQATAQFNEMDSLLAQVVTMYHLAQRGENPLTKEEAAHATIMCIKKALLAAPVNINLPCPPDRFNRKSKHRPWYVWSIDRLHEALEPIHHLWFVQHFLKWWEERAHTLKKYLYSIFIILAFFARMLYTAFKACWTILWFTIATIADTVFKSSKAKRIKNAWALSGLALTPKLSARARLEQEIAWSTVKERSDFMTDFNEFTSNLTQKHSNKNKNRNKTPDLNKPQQRRVGWGKPVMSHQEAQYLGFGPDDYEIDEIYQNRIDRYLEMGTPQGADCVYFGKANPDRIRQSINRYSPKYEEISSQDRDLADQIAQCLVDKHPEALSDWTVTSPKGILSYVKEKYSPGSPFLGTYKSRQEMFAAGWDETLIENCEEKLLKGEYPVQFYHAFVKSQVVNIDKVVNENKNLRTVVAQDLASYFIDQVIQIEKNKRITWRSTGAGMGMVLNQNMNYLYRQLMKHKQMGGSFILSDATEYDSRNKPFTFEFLGRLAEKGFKGSNRAIPSVLRSHYDSMGNAWIFGITEENLNSLSFVCNKDLQRDLFKSNPSKYVLFNHINRIVQDNKWDWFQDKSKIEFLYKDKFVLLDNINQLYDVSNPKSPKILFSSPYHSAITYHDVADKDQTEILDSNRLASQTEDSLHLKYMNTTFNYKNKQELLDIMRSYEKNPALVQNVHAKNRGGGTGQSATSWDNTWGFKGSFIAGLCRYFDYQYSPSEIYTTVKELNDDGIMKARNKNPNAVLFNTGDDNVWTLNLPKSKINQQKLYESMLYYGISLTIEVVNGTNELEYLGNLCRVPTREDKKVLEAMQKAYRHYANVSEQPLPINQPFPKTIIYKDQNAVMLRRTALRYYQASMENFTYLFSSIQRNVGHIANTAFSPQLYRMFTQEYIEDVHRLAHILNIPSSDYKVEFKSDRFGLETVGIRTPVGKKNNKELLRGAFGKSAVQQLRHFNRLLCDIDSLEFEYNKTSSPSKKRELDNRIQRARKDRQKYQDLEMSKKLFSYFIHLNRCPSYEKIIRDHMRLEDRDTLKDHELFMKKLEKNAAEPDLFIRQITDFASGLIGDIPREIYKMTPNFLSLYPDATFYTFNKYIEKFIYVYNFNTITNLASFQSLCAQSPYGAVTAASHFYESLLDPEIHADVFKYVTTKEIKNEEGEITEIEYTSRTYKNAVICITIVYAVLYPIERWIITIRFIGVAYRLLMFTLIDIPKLYSVVGLFNWLSTARSSPLISALMPKDPYLQMKRFSAFLVDFIPIQLFWLLPFDFIVDLTPVVLECFTKIWRGGQDIKKDHLFDPENRNPWKDLILPSTSDFAKQFNTGQNMTIQSATGTGKSTLLLHALITANQYVNPDLSSRRRFRKIWLLVPRRILRDEYSTSYLSNVRQHANTPYNYALVNRDNKLIADKTETLLAKASIYITTYGHALQIKDQIHKDDLIICDEFHELQGEMIKLIDQNDDQNQKLYLSATPIVLPFTESINFDARTVIPPRFSKRLYVKDDTVVNNFLWAREQPQFREQAKNAIIRVSTFHEIDQVRDALHYNNIKTFEVSKRTAGMPIPNDETVLITSQIITAGVNLPGRRLLIDSGKMIVNHQGQIHYVPTDRNTHQQIIGRVGRFQDDDICIFPSFAGTNKTNFENYPSSVIFDSEAVASHFNMPKLESFTETEQNEKNEIGENKYQYFKEMPYLLFDATKIPSGSQIAIKNIALYHLLLLSGIKENELKKYWYLALDGRLQEEHHFINTFVKIHSVPYLHFNIVQNYALLPDVSIYKLKYTSLKNKPPVTSGFDFVNKVKVNVPAVKDQLEFYTSNTPLLPYQGRWCLQIDSSIKSQEFIETNTETIWESYQSLLDDQLARTKAEYRSMITGIKKIIGSQTLCTAFDKKKNLRQYIKKLEKSMDGHITQIQKNKFSPPPNITSDGSIYSMPVFTKYHSDRPDDSPLFHTIEESKSCSICNKTENHFHSLTENIHNPPSACHGHHQWTFFFVEKPKV